MSTLREQIGQIIDPLGLEVVARMNALSLHGESTSAEPSGKGWG